MNFNVESLELRQLTKEDVSVFSSLVKMFNMVFEEAESAISNEANLLGLLNNNNFIAMAAISENEVVGGLTAYELPMYYSDSSEVFVYDMAVKPEYQRMGIGKSLIRSLREYCIKHG